MILSQNIQQQLKRKSGSDLRLPSDIEFLALDIESQTGEHMGVNTLKRLLGFIDDERQARVSTLDIIARYLGYADWEVLSALDAKSNSGFDDTEGLLCASSLKEGQCVEVTYLPDRRVVLRHESENRFSITESENSKLHVDDVVLLTHFVQGYPMLVSQVIRGDLRMGSFIAGKARGISYHLL